MLHTFRNVFDINWANRGGQTVLMRAANSGHSVLITYILSQPLIKLHLMDADGYSASDGARGNGVYVRV